MKTYGQYCPIARATEVLGERWTLLILRDLLYGARRFNDIRRGVPLMSPSLLSQRLKQFEKNGLVVRARNLDTGVLEYQPTPAAQELSPVIELLGAWGQRWVRNRLSEDELDVSLLMWYVRCAFDAEKFASERTVVAFEFTDRPRLKKENWWLDKWWLVIEEGDIDLCLKDPGYEVDLYVISDLRTMTRLYMGDISIPDAVRFGAVELHGSRDLAQIFEQWMPVSHFGKVPPPPEPLELARILAGFKTEAAE